jgi:hypothetical protein
MSDYVIALIVLALLLLVPQTRRAMFEILSVTAVAAVGVAALGLPVWALYEADPLLGPSQPPVAAAEDGTGQLDALLEQQEAERRRLEEEEGRRQAEEQRKREEEQARIAGIAKAVRAIVERERKYAAVAASGQRLPAADGILKDLIGIRVPGWRDSETAEREKALILAWLLTIGVTSEETASIRTANGWGSVYDLWSAEQSAVAGEPVSETGEVVSLTVDPPAAAEPASEGDVASEPESEPEPEPEPEVVQPEPRPFSEQQRQWRPVPRWESAAPRVPAPVRRPPPRREVGPFGY